MSKLQTVLRVTVTADFPFDAMDAKSLISAQNRAHELELHAIDLSAVNIIREGKVLRTKVEAAPVPVPTSKP